MKRKCLMAWVLTAAMSISLLTGCGGKSSDTTTADVPATTEKKAETSAEAKEETTGEPEYVVKFSHDGPSQGAQYDGQTYFKERLEELSGGRIRVDLYPGASLADKATSMEGMQLGTIEAAEVSIINMSSYNDMWDVFALPYYFDNDVQACALCRDSKVYDILQGNAEENGFMILGIVTVGGRDIYSKKPINSVEDMKGLKIRVLNSNSLIVSMSDMGASPLSLPWNDCYSAMQQGTIDAVENSTEVLYSNSFTELDGAYSFTNHFNMPDLLLFSKAVYDSMPADLQEAVIQAGIDTEKQWNEVIYKKASDEALKSMQEKGVEIIHPDLSGFQASAEKTRDKIIGSFNEQQKELYEAIDTVKDNYK